METAFKKEKYDSKKNTKDEMATRSRLVQVAVAKTCSDKDSATDIGIAAELPSYYYPATNIRDIELPSDLMRCLLARRQPIIGLH